MASELKFMSELKKESSFVQRMVETSLRFLDFAFSINTDDYEQYRLITFEYLNRDATYQLQLTNISGYSFSLNIKSTYPDGGINEFNWNTFSPKVNYSVREE